MQQRFQEELGDILWYISDIATCCNLDLDAVAVSNREKCEHRWGKKTHLADFFDAKFPDDEQFPRVMIFKVSEIVGGTAKLALKGFGTDWIQIGARVTDNAHTDDGYRFHDVLHLAHVAVLGWSPVFRSLLNRKRKSNKKMDEVEDGARAIILEEALTALVYEHAREVAFFKDEQCVPFELLKLIERITGALEVSRATYDLWNQAILVGYAAWRSVNENKGGYLKCDMTKKELRYAKTEGEL